MKGKPILAVSLGLWAAAAVTGLGLLWGYSSVKGPVGHAPKELPPQFRISKQKAERTLLMALHPHCPCSRASMSELAKALTRSKTPCRPVILMFKPKAEPDSWVETDLWRESRRLNSDMRIDENGDLARSLGMLTSEQVLLYDQLGILRFEGGITNGRGHEGDNLGQSILERILGGENVISARLPVYGCIISAEEERARED